MLREPLYPRSTRDDRRAGYVRMSVAVVLILSVYSASEYIDAPATAVKITEVYAWLFVGMGGLFCAAAAVVLFCALSITREGE